MPMFEYICEVCGASKRVWRPEGKPPRFCGNKDCWSIGMSGRSLKPKKWVITPEMDEIIRRTYLNNTGNGEIRDLAKRLGVPRWKVTRHAVKNGYIAKQKKEPAWSEKELHVLRNSAHLSPKRIQDRLKKYGFHRTEIGIVLKRKRMRYLQNLKGQSGTSLALCFGVDYKTVRGYILKGLLAAEKRGTDRTDAQGGDMWFIKDAHIKNFVMDNVAAIDFRKLDKYWLVDLLGGK